MKILVVEDEKHIRQGIVQMLECESFEVDEAESVTTALGCIHDNNCDVILCDHNLPDGDSLDLLRALPQVKPLIVMTAFGDRDLASRVFSAGAYDYVSKPLRFDELFARLHRLEETWTLKQQFQNNQKHNQAYAKFATLGQAAVMKGVQQLIQTASSAPVPVLLQGETGVGKGVVARLIHSMSEAAKQPFIRVNCAAIPQELMESEFFGHVKGAFSGANRERKGLLGSAEKGCLFLDELIELPLMMQSKLLHVLDEHQFRAVGSDKELKFQGRIIAASNVNFEQAITDGRLREDLFFRINTMQITIPPLRERTVDIVPLAHHLLGEITEAWGMPKACLSDIQGQWLESQAWAGNVRQLRNTLERAVLMGGCPQLCFSEMSSPHVVKKQSLHQACSDFEQAYIQQIIKANDGDKVKASHDLAISLSSLYRKMERSHS